MLPLYIIRKFPFTDTLVDDIAIFFPNSRCSISWNQVCQLAQRFAAEVPQQSIVKLHLQLVWSCALTGRPRFPHLAECVLSLPVSNADTKRVFSNVRKNCDRLSN